MKRLEGKTCVVTAAGAGIGRATALRMAYEGGKVYATDINPDTLASLKHEAADKGLTIQTDILDVTSNDAIEHYSRQTGSTDVLFNCAGFVAGGTILECSNKDYEFSFELNVRSLFHMMKTFLPGMLDQGAGSIVNIASVAGSISGVPNRFIYGATKAAVIGMTKSVAADFVAKGIRCNVICPGTIDSPSLQDRMRAQGNYEEARAAFVARQPMGRLGRAEEVAALACYLASDEAGFTTGQTHNIDGGWTT
ncbi:SDR family oxidoreductase [Thalassospira lucentensis]|uniref:SDR family oxidoreductase n=1 Tax=Thalassospira lucentensis TaxID=168935 RepID=UPI003D2EF933